MQFTFSDFCGGGDRRGGGDGGGEKMMRGDLEK